MWNDNETNLDFLGFDDLVAELVELVHQPGLLPLTVGVFGDWGSGKSSLMGMARAELMKNERVLTVGFSPWQHEDYDDVKTALILAVMGVLSGKQSPIEKLKDSQKDGAKRLLRRLRKRVNVLRALGWAVRGVSSAVLASQGDLPAAAAIIGSGALAAGASTLNDVGEKAAGAIESVADLDETDGGEETAEQSVGQFRRDFADLIRGLDIDVLVVFIDDLDRCLPETVVDTLEAVKLFLAVPKTAFVVGADERIVRHAIGRRYPELASQSVDAIRPLDIGRDYLEKMIQIPIRIPAMTTSETETYLNLLGAQLHLGDADLQEAVTAARVSRASGLTVPFNHGVAQAALTTLKPGLAEHIALITRIAPVLAVGCAGNPRQAKRFLNTLVQRQRIARRRKIHLKADILAKLMLLEYFHLNEFKDLFRWQTEAGEKPAMQMADLERAATDRADPLAKGATTAVDPAVDLKSWLENPALTQWLRLEPPLAKESLEAYFHYSRDRFSTTAPPTRRLPPELQELVVRLQAPSETERDLARKEFAKLQDAEARAVFDDLAGTYARDPRAMDNKLGPLLIGMAADRRTLVASLVAALSQADMGSIQTAMALQLKLGFKPDLPDDLARVLQGWSTKGPDKLASAARQALK